MNRITDRLKKEWDEDPVKVIAATAGLLTATAMFINAVANAKGRRTWAKEVNRRDRMSRSRYPYGGRR